jgi:hypothetical protein
MRIVKLPLWRPSTFIVMTLLIALPGAVGLITIEPR